MSAVRRQAILPTFRLSVFLHHEDDMAVFSQTGFYFYRNCFYDLQFRDKTKKTLRLIDIKNDTLHFIGIACKTDVDLAQTSKDTFAIDHKDIDKLLLIKDWGAQNTKKIDCDDYYFIFYKSLITSTIVNMPRSFQVVNKVNWCPF